MNRDDIIRMAEEAGWHDGLLGVSFTVPLLERFAALVAAEKDKEIARLREENVYLKGVYEDLVEDRKELFDDLDKAVAAEREKVAAWMRSKSYATGHGDTIEDLLKELEWQVAEREREACAKVCEGEQFELTQDVAGKNGLQHFDAGCRSCAEMIRARGEM